MLVAVQEDVDPSYAETDPQGTFTNPPAAGQGASQPASSTPGSSTPLTPLQGNEYWNDDSNQYPFRSKASPEEFWTPRKALINKQPDPSQSTKFLGYYYPELATPASSSPAALSDTVCCTPCPG